jgi:hypothetical protein
VGPFKIDPISGCAISSPISGSEKKENGGEQVKRNTCPVGSVDGLSNSNGNQINRESFKTN